MGAGAEQHRTSLPDPDSGWEKAQSTKGKGPGEGKSQAEPTFWLDWEKSKDSGWWKGYMMRKKLTETIAGFGAIWKRVNKTMRDFKTLSAVIKIQRSWRRYLFYQDRLLHVDRPEWNEAISQTRNWTANDQVRFNVAMTFCRLGKVSTDWEDGLIRALEDRCGQVAAMALLALERIASPIAQTAVLSYLKSRRWDETLTPHTLC